MPPTVFRVIRALIWAVFSGASFLSGTLLAMFMVMFLVVSATGTERTFLVEWRNDLAESYIALHLYGEPGIIGLVVTADAFLFDTHRWSWSDFEHFSVSIDWKGAWPVEINLSFFRPIYPLALTAILPLSWLGVRLIWRKKKRTLPGHCRKCDYNLIGTLAAGHKECPECGAAVDPGTMLAAKVHQPETPEIVESDVPSVKPSDDAGSGI